MTMTVEVFSRRKKCFFNLFFYVLTTEAATGRAKKAIQNFTLFTGKHVCWRLQHTCFPVNIAKFLRTPILKNICERLLLLPKPWLYRFLALYSFKLIKHSHFSIFTTLHANSASKIKERGDISYNSNVTII